MEERAPYQTPEEEIRYLEQKILEKKKELEGREPRSITREVLEEHIQAGSQLPAGDAAAGSQDTSIFKDIDEHVAMLVGVAFSRGVRVAVELAKRTHDPHLIDAFHDALVDRFLEQLRAKGMLER